MTQEYSIERLPDGWEIRKVWIRYSGKPIQSRFEIIDKATGFRYLHEPLNHISQKCLAVFFGGHLYGFGYILWHFLRAPLVALNIAFRAVREAILRPGTHPIQRLFNSLFWKAPVALIQNMIGAVRAPFYVFAIVLSGLYGCFNPLQGRVMIAQIEQSWHHRERRDDIVHFEDETLLQKIWRGFTEPDNKRTRFLAYCMQPWGRLTDANVVKTELSRN